MDRFVFNFESLILLLTVFQGGFYSLFLLFGKDRGRLQSRLLGIFTLVFTLHFANVLLVEYGPLERDHNVNPVFILCYGPLLLLFIRSLVRPHFTMRNARAHFIGPVVGFVIIAAFGSGTWVVDGLLPVLVILHMIAYLAVANRELTSFRKELRNRFSAIDTINLDWLTRLMKQMFFILGIGIAHLAAQSAGLPALQSAFTIMIFLTALYFVNTLVLKGMSHPSIDVWLDEVAPGPGHDELLGEAPDPGAIPTEEGDDDARYGGSGLSPEESREHFERLCDLMIRDEPFLDENLNIHQLAESMGISSKHLSQVINQNADQNFYDFINGYRIEKAKALLVDPEQTDLRVSEVMLESGFTSKSTFNSLFKRATGLTPTEFRQKNRPNS